ncbi:hypothetical protein M3Y98_01012500 [Aphelenchoides besseyi]|nr:hypothetical protein M3Y98_01012500 [Aphelenchoides besseyi]KAI6210150.1 hypothetical protein M3Y96_00297300 [Aphelenchoides besseyi]
MFFPFLLLVCLAEASFRFIPEHVFNLDVALICQPRDVRLTLNAMVSMWEADTFTKDDRIGKVNVEEARSFHFLYRHEEFGEISPYMIILHDCDPRVIKDKCYAQTEYHFAAPEQLGSTLFLNIDLLKEHTDIICDRGYPFVRLPPEIPDLISADPQILSPLTTSNVQEDETNMIINERAR